MTAIEIQLDELIKKAKSVNFLRLLGLLKILFSRRIISEQDIQKILFA